MRLILTLALLASLVVPATAQILTPAERATLREAATLLLRLGEEPANTPRVISTAAALQSALDAAQPGDTLELADGVYVGTFVLPDKAGFVTLRGNAELRNPLNIPVQVGSYWRIQGLTFSAASPLGDLVRVGTSTQTLEEVPHHVVFDGIHLKGDPLKGQKRGLAMNGAHIEVINSRCTDIKLAGQDTQCLIAWNGPGPFLIENNHLEGAGENIMFGGADPSIPNLIPCDITFRGNTVTKPLEWKDHPSGWTIKNLLELKNACRVLIEKNTFSNNWRHAQSGYALLMKSVNQDGGCPWCGVSDVIVRDNQVRNVSAILNIVPAPQGPAVPFRGLLVENNYFHTDHHTLGGDGRCLTNQGVLEVIFRRNTCETSGTAVIYFEGAGGSTHLEGNILPDHLYGIKGAGRVEGRDTLNFYTSAFLNNLIISPGSPQLYPTSGGNVVVEKWPAETAGFGAKQ